MSARRPTLPRSLAVLLVGLAATAVAVAGMEAPVHSQPAGARVVAVDTSDHPTVRLTVVATDPDLDTVSVTQNGEPRPVTDAAPFGGDLQLVLVIDASAAMADELRSAVAAATEFALRLPADTEVGLVSAGAQPDVVAAPTADTGAVLAALAEVQPGGDPALLPALSLALDAFTTDSGRRAVILLAGSDHGDGAALDDVAAHLRAEGVSLFGVGLAGGVMEQLAASAGGRVETLDGMDEAAEALRGVVEDLDRLYLVGFLASEETGPAELSVAVGDDPESWATLTVPLSATDAEQREAAQTAGDESPAGDAAPPAGDEPASRDTGAWIPVTGMLALLALVTGFLLFVRRRGPPQPAPGKGADRPEGGVMDEVEATGDDSEAVQQRPDEPEAVQQRPGEPEAVQQRPGEPEAVRREAPDRQEVPVGTAGTENMRPEPPHAEDLPGEGEPAAPRPEPRRGSGDDAPPDAPVGDAPPAEADGREPPAWHLPPSGHRRARLGTTGGGSPALTALLADALAGDGDLSSTLRWEALSTDDPVADAAQRLADRLADGDDLATGLAALGPHEHEGVDWARAAVEVHRDLGGDLPTLLRIADRAVAEQFNLTEEWGGLRLEAQMVFLALVLQPIAVVALGGLITTGIGAIEVGLLAAAAVLTAAGGWWLHRITRPPFDWRPSRWRQPHPDRAEEAAVLDLAAMAVAAGAGVAEAVRRAARGGRPETAQHLLEVVRPRSGDTSDDAAAPEAEDGRAPDAAESAVGLLRSEAAHLRQRAVADLRSGTPRIRRAAVVPYLVCILPACILALVALL